MPKKITKSNKKLLCLGDFHLRPNLGYSDLIEDGRRQEKQQILDFIIKQSKDVEKIVILGDMLNSKQNASSVIKEAIEFLEKFGTKEIFILLGNHEIISSSENSAISFLKEIKGKNWHIIESIQKIGEYVFAPYLNNIMLGTETNSDGAKKAIELLESDKMLFCHQALSSTSINGSNTDFFNEVVLPKKELGKHFEKIFAGHVHQHNKDGKFLVASSIFMNEVNETEKYIYKIDEDTLDIEEIPLPGRQILSIENPTSSDIKKLKPNSIVKAIITDKNFKPQIDDLKEQLEKQLTDGGFIFLEQIPKTRKKLHYDGEKSLLEFTVLELLELYAKEKKIEFNLLKKGFELL